MTVPIDKKLHIHYPTSDGKRMAENTLQYDWIALIKSNLDKTTQGQKTFIAGDLLWYPVEGNNKLRVAPDVMAAIGRPKGHRGSYLQWLEDNIPPQVVFEILSPGNTPKEMIEKLAFYERFGAQEYYIYDPDRNNLKVYIREGASLILIPNVKDWVSPLLKIRFLWTTKTLELFHPTGERFLSNLETLEEMDEMKTKIEENKVELKEKDNELKEIQQEANEAKDKLAQLEARLRQLGIDPNTV